MPPEEPQTDQPKQLTLPPLPPEIAQLSERITVGPVLAALIAQTREELVDVAAFEVNNDQAFSPFSPVTLNEADTETLVQRLENASGCIVIPELFLEKLLQSLPIETENRRIIRYDLQKEDDRAAFANPHTLNEIRTGLSKGTILVIAEHIDALQSPEIDKCVRYAIEHHLRTIEDLMHGNSLFVATVTAGERLPVFTTMEHSPALLSAPKAGFSKNRDWQSADLGEQRPVNMKALSEKPRRDLNEIFGAERREDLRKLIEDVRGGHNVIVTGPRRGGKTSTLLIIVETLEAEDDNNIVFRHNNLEDTFIKDDIVRELLIFDDDTVRFAVVQEIMQCELPRLPGLLKSIIRRGDCRWSGKRLVFTSDEAFDHSMQIDGKEVVDFFRFSKFAKEEAIPVSSVNVTIRWYWPQLIRLLRNNSHNVEQAELSAFTVHDLMPFSDDEARSLLENLLSRINRTFPTEQDREMFIADMIELCSGNVSCLNLAIDIFERTGDRSKIVKQVDTLLLGLHSSLIKIQLSPQQRHIVTRLCWAKNGCITLNEPDMYLADIADMEKSEYIESYFEDQEKTRLHIKLLNPHGFRLAMKPLFGSKLHAVGASTPTEEQQFWEAAQSGRVDINDVVPKPNFRGM